MKHTQAISSSTLPSCAIIYVLLQTTRITLIPFHFVTVYNNEYRTEKVIININSKRENLAQHPQGDELLKSVPVRAVELLAHAWLRGVTVAYFRW
jgi:hypothetical protein